MGESAPVMPVRGDERIAFMDVLRGFAVLGIFLANIPFMGFAAAVAAGTETYIGGDSWVDYWCYGFVFVLVDTKFVTLFSTLFGAGLALMSEKALAAGAPFVARYSRRLVLLFLFGALHITLFWFGDILVVYSLIGFAAMWFRKCKVKTLVVLAGIAMVLSFAMWMFFAMLDPEDFMEPATDDQGVELSFEEQNQRKIEETRQVLGSGSFVEMVEKRLSFYLEFVPFLLMFFGPRTFALFLLGMALVKSGWIATLGSRRDQLLGLAFVGVPLGVILCGGSLCADQVGDRQANGMAVMGLLFFGGLFLAAGYAAMIALWCHSSVWQGLRARLAAVGRMALTNYITHSLVSSIVFNWCGQFDTWKRPAMLGLVFAVFAFQLWFSPLWLRHFRFGPLEWLWRTATYGGGVSLRRA